MLLTFSRDAFKYRILAGTKITTIRKDPTGRWKVGTVIHFWRGNPRNAHNAKDKPHPFGQGRIDRIEKMEIEYLPDKSVRVYLDGRRLTELEIWQLSVLDGFDNPTYFFNWFNENFSGVRLHWQHDQCLFYDNHA